MFHVIAHGLYFMRFQIPPLDIAFFVNPEAGNKLLTMKWKALTGNYPAIVLYFNHKIFEAYLKQQEDRRIWIK
jgi:hypothetical protein